MRVLDASKSRLVWEAKPLQSWLEIAVLYSNFSDPLILLCHVLDSLDFDEAAESSAKM